MKKNQLTVLKQELEDVKVTKDRYEKQLEELQNMLMKQTDRANAFQAEVRKLRGLVGYYTEIIHDNHQVAVHLTKPQSPYDQQQVGRQ